MQAIKTKYIPATNFKSSRIKASCDRGSIYIDYPHELSGDAIHIAAADALVDKFVKEDAERYGTNENPWSKPRVCGSVGNECFHVYSPIGFDSVIVQFQDSADKKRFLDYAQDAKNQSGTVTGLSAGLMCSALKRATI